MMGVEYVRFSIKKALLYRANLVSWILADLSLYASTFMYYFLLSRSVSQIGDYRGFETVFYISCFLLVNNLFAAFFAEAVSNYLSDILNGRFASKLLRPRHLISNYVLSNLNTPALFSTPLLIAVNIYLLRSLGANPSVVYFLITVSGAVTMGLIYAVVYSFALYGLRVNLISSVVFEMIQISERPDTVFSKRVRNFLVYLVPVYLFSAIPARYALGRATIYEGVWAFCAPVLFYLLLQYCVGRGLKKYQEGFRNE